jgi:hypothetical protein
VDSLALTGRNYDRKLEGDQPDKLDLWIICSAADNARGMFEVAFTHLLFRTRVDRKEARRH